MAKVEYKAGWEEAVRTEFPIVCDNCLGENPYLRMTKLAFGSECAVCSKPSTLFRWSSGTGERYKRTDICQTCAKIKHCCQSCLFDLDFGLPTQVRDSILNIKQDVPKAEVNRQFFSRNMESQLSKSDAFLDTSKMDSASKEILKKLSKTHPYTMRNKAHVCTFFLKGQCKRGEGCPFRHDLPQPTELMRQNVRTLREKYYGQKDFVGEKLLEKAKTLQIVAPEDKSITSVFISGIGDTIVENDLRDFFYAFGEIKSIVILMKKKMAFVNYLSRESAERAVESCLNDIVIKGCQLRVTWGKPKQQGPKEEHVVKYDDNSIPLPPGVEPINYPSQDPFQMGSITKTNK